MLGWLVNQRVWETHVSIGLLAAIIALFVLRPHPRIGTDAIRTLARFAPTVTLVYGLFMYMDVLRGTTVVWIHITLGVITVAPAYLPKSRPFGSTTIGFPCSRARSMRARASSGVTTPFP